MFHYVLDELCEDIPTPKIKRLTKTLIQKEEERQVTEENLKSIHTQPSCEDDSDEVIETKLKIKNILNEKPYIEKFKSN